MVSYSVEVCQQLLIVEESMRSRIVSELVTVCRRDLYLRSLVALYPVENKREAPTTKFTDKK